LTFPEARVGLSAVERPFLDMMYTILFAEKTAPMIAGHFSWLCGTSKYELAVPLLSSLISSKE
jgi:hypothetical protein